ncbi:MAG: hypothetical protein R3A13_08265 [Bdellovibrionota bacterium]
MNVITARTGYTGEDGFEFLLRLRIPLNYGMNCWNM